MATVRHPAVFFVVAALAGVGWTLSASELWVAAQRAMPSWVRGRMSATVMMVSQGAMAVGGLIWGSAVTTAGPAYSLLAAAALLLVSLVLAGPLSIDFTTNLDLDPVPVTRSSYQLLYTPKPDDGPVSICVEFNVDQARVPAFLSIMRKVRLIHLRNGAYRWLTTNRWFGRYLRDYREEHGATLGTKLFSLCSLWLGMGVSAYFLRAHLWVDGLLLVIAIGVTIHLLTLNTINRNAA